MGQVWQPVHLESAFSDAPPAINEAIRDKILHAASRSRTRERLQPTLILYVRVPRDMRAWVHCKIAPPDPEAPVPLTVGQRIAFQQVKRQPSLSPTAFSVPDPDIHFLKLDEEHVADLAIHHRTRVQRFSGAIRVVEPPPGTQLAREYVNADVVAPVRVRPWDFFHADTESDYPIEDLPDDPEHGVEIGLGDVYLDKLVALNLRDAFGLPLSNGEAVLLAMQGEGSLRLPCPTYGVELLYKVAKEQYKPAMISAGLKLPRSHVVAEEFHTRDPKLFSKSERAAQAARLTRPDAARNQGLSPGEHRAFTDEAQRIFETEYTLRAPFVSDALALIAHAAKHWLYWESRESPPRSTAKAQLLWNELRRYGFKGNAEIEAIFAFITWKNGRFTHPPKNAVPPKT